MSGINYFHSNRKMTEYPPKYCSCLRLGNINLLHLLLVNYILYEVLALSLDILDEVQEKRLPSIDVLRSLVDVDIPEGWERSGADIHGEAVDYSTASSLADSTQCTSHFKMALLTDNKGNQTSYQFVDSSGFVLFAADGLQSDNYYEAVECLTVGYKYKFTISDMDGICCNNGHGYYALSMNSEDLHEGGDFNIRRNVVFTAKGVDEL